MFVAGKANMMLFYMCACACVWACVCVGGGGGGGGVNYLYTYLNSLIVMVIRYINEARSYRMPAYGTRARVYGADLEAIAWRWGVPARPFEALVSGRNTLQLS